jgi:tRNA(fMet)-specific endonuclease VapC
MRKFMLDTNICIFTIKNKPDSVRQAFNQRQGQLCVSAITAMELTYGAEKSAAPARNLSVVEGFLARLDVLDYDRAAAANTGQLRAELALAGTPVGPYDAMIAGHARSQGLILVTNNTREFSRVPGLRLEDWATARLASRHDPGAPPH